MFGKRNQGDDPPPTTHIRALDQYRTRNQPVPIISPINNIKYSRQKSLKKSNREKICVLFSEAVKSRNYIFTHTKTNNGRGYY